MSGAVRKGGANRLWRLGLLAVLITGLLPAPLRLLLDHGRPVLAGKAALADKGSSDGGDGDGGGHGSGSNSGSHESGSNSGSGGDDGGSGGGDDSGGGSDDGGSHSDGDDNSGHGSDDGSDDNSGHGSDDGSDDDGSAATAGTGRLEAADRASRSGGDHYRPDELIVLNEDAAFFARVRQLGFTVLEQRPLGALGLTITRLRVPRPLTPDRGLALLRRTFPRLLVDVNALYRPQATLSLPAPDYAEAMIGWGAAPEGCGRAIRLGMIDTGVVVSRPPFGGRRIHRRSFVAESASPAPTEHGTAIAALLIGRGGLLPAATLYAAEIFSENADGIATANVVGIAAALDWLVANDVPVVNISLAGDANLLMKVAVSRAADRGTVLVAAAGNGGPDATAAYPAAYDKVLAVTAVDSRSRPYNAANRGDYIDFAAPGVRIWIAGQAGGSYYTGTSFATPFVSAAVAAQLGLGADRDGARMREQLARTALDLGAPGKDAVFGWGLLQAGAPCAQTATKSQAE